MPDPERTPVLVAVGQTESRDLSLGPVELAEEAARRAFSAAPGLAKAIRRVTVVNILSRRAGVAPASELAAGLGLSEATCETTSIGGNTPQAMVERAASDIASGKLDATLIVGAEAVRSGRLKGAASPTAEGSSAAIAAPLQPDPVIGVDRQDLSDEERMAGLFIPVQVYPLFESALAARAGRSPAEQRHFIGTLMAPFTEVAARHEHAWFRQARTPAEIATPGPDNRLVAEPYTKLMVAFLGGAQAAALVLTSLAVARSLKLADDAVYVWSSGSANDVWNPMARPDLGASAGVKTAAASALRAAGVGIDDVSLFDLYSCFPSAVQIAAAAVGLPTGPQKPGEESRLTVTGGLPYFGGPGNNYSSHAIATMFDRLRVGEANALGLVTAVGWYLTKHSVGIYGSSPPPSGFKAADNRRAQQRIDASAVACARAGEDLAMNATIDASTVMYDREGQAVTAPAIATLEDGRRVAASAAEGDVAEAAGRFLVGAKVSIRATAGAPTAPQYHLIG